MKFTLYTASCTGNEKNILYPYCVDVTNEDILKSAVQSDHVSAKFSGYKRSNANFIESDCLMFDCDNSHSENSEDWVTPLELALTFPEVAFAAVYSRNHMKPKGTKAPRPKFHVYFAAEKGMSVTERQNLKKQVLEQFPYFDEKALDEAHFFFGVEHPKVEWYQGNLTLAEFFEKDAFAEWDAQMDGIPEGSRNSTMSRIAGKLVKRYGATEEAYQRFLKTAETCNPPLSDTELQQIWKSAERFGTQIAKQKGYIAPEHYGQLFQFRPEDYSDLGQAKIFAGQVQEELAYTDATEYLCYQKNHWVESKQLAVGRCEAFLDKQLEEAEKTLEITHKMLLDSGVDAETISKGGKVLEKAVDDTSRKAYIEYRSALTYRAFVMKRRDMKYISATLQAAKPMLLKDIADFDSQAFLLNTPTATYDLQKGVNGGRPHRPEDYLTKMTAVSPDNVGEEIWKDALHCFFCDDQSLIDYVQQICGLCAIGKVYQEALMIAYGEGSNGKSTFWNAISRVLGSYSGTMSADALTVGCKRNVKPEMAELKGKRLVIAAELEEGMRLNTAVIKQLCSTDEIQAEKKYKDPFRYTPAHTLVLYTNHLPRVGANDAGTWRRLIVIPFLAKLEGKSDIKNFADYLVEHAGGSILSWVMEGAKQVIDRQFKLEVPQCVKKAIHAYRESNDWMSAFLEDCCDVDKTYQQKSGELYQEYRSYCSRNGEYTRSTTDFYTGLENAGFERKRTKKGVIVYGLKIKSEFLE